MNSFSIIEHTSLFKNGTNKHVFTTMTLTAPHTCPTSLASVSSSFTFTSPVRVSWIFTFPVNTNLQPSLGQLPHRALPRSGVSGEKGKVFVTLCSHLSFLLFQSNLKSLRSGKGTVTAVSKHSAGMSPSGCLQTAGVSHGNESPGIPHLRLRVEFGFEPWVMSADRVPEVLKQTLGPFSFQSEIPMARPSESRWRGKKHRDRNSWKPLVNGAPGFQRVFPANILSAGQSITSLGQVSQGVCSLLVGF